MENGSSGGGGFLKGSSLLTLFVCVCVCVYVRVFIHEVCMFVFGMV